MKSEPGTTIESGHLTDKAFNIRRLALHDANTLVELLSNPKNEAAWAGFPNDDRHYFVGRLNRLRHRIISLSGSRAEVAAAHQEREDATDISMVGATLSRWRDATRARVKASIHELVCASESGEAHLDAATLDSIMEALRFTERCIGVHDSAAEDAAPEKDALDSAWPIDVSDMVGSTLKQWRNETTLMLDWCVRALKERVGADAVLREETIQHLLWGLAFAKRCVEVHDYAEKKALASTAARTPISAVAPDAAREPEFGEAAACRTPDPRKMVGCSLEEWRHVTKRSLNSAFVCLKHRPTDQGGSIVLSASSRALVTDAIAQAESCIDTHQAAADRTISVSIREWSDELIGNLMQMAKWLWRNSLISDPTIHISRFNEWMRRPQVGDFVVETTAGMTGREPARDCMGTLLRVQNITKPGDTKDEEFWFIQTLDGREIGFSNCEFVRIPWGTSYPALAVPDHPGSCEPQAKLIEMLNLMAESDVLAGRDLKVSTEDRRRLGGGLTELGGWISRGDDVPNMKDALETLQIHQRD